ncbi:hypothetical protein SAMN04489835_2222 [Mycolicibacterium rutilum]|uniref:DUF3291 domain-containing protein n=1 Tax=Mycolicibacterium rutilum TaxID=370526 RepID=A0A1H6JQM6_MYCRU|nr:hypothetical protein [Mycolicibacterium rutilum]SEH62931.1 hypothetical protein SAMN04489835_2222 [Mycolicibacterium rutilum]
MPTLPWTTPTTAEPPTAPALVMASRFELKRYRDVPGFLVAALRIRRQMLRSPGVLGVSLIAQPRKKTFYTLSAWRDRSALDAAVAEQPHVATMAKFRTRMADSVFTFWDRAEHTPPGWPEAHRRLGQRRVVGLGGVQ